MQDPAVSKPCIEQSSADDVAEERKSEDVEMRTLTSRTAQLWSAVNLTKHADDILRGSPQSFPAFASHMSLLEQNVCVEDGNSTLDSDDVEYGEGDECIKMESVDMVLQSMTRVGNYFAGDAHPSWPLIRRRSVEERANGMGSDNGHENERSEDISKDTARECGKLQLEQGDDTSNRVITASKARAITNAMLNNLIRLGFREDITQAALEAGALEIDQYDSDCDVAYGDIFMSLVKMVCDAHVDVMSGGDDVEQSWTSQDRNSSSHVQAYIADVKPPSSLKQSSFLPFKWPVFDMAQFEFESARSGTCFDSVCVLTNLPVMSIDRTEELMEVLSCNLFCMIGDPIQVVIPSTNSTRRTKGHAFLEFDGPDIAQKCASAVDGLTWGRGSLGRIRGNLFRQYQMKAPAAGDWRASLISGDRASIPRSFVSVPGSKSLLDDAAVLFPTSGHHDNRKAERFRPGLGIAQEQPSICDSDEDDSDLDEWGFRRPLEYEQFIPSSRSHLSSGSAGISEQYEPTQHDIAMQLGWDDEASDDEYSAQQKRKVDDNENDKSFDSNSVLELQGFDEEELMGHSLCKELVREYPPTRISLSLHEVPTTSSTVTSTASAVALEPHADCDITMQSWDVDEGNDVVNKPWRRHCEDLVLRNCEMQEQIAFARRRIVQLSHNNQKLHLLIDRVERDRDGLLLENNALQAQLHEHKDYEQHHDFLMKELISLRKRVTQQEHFFGGQTLDPLQQLEAVCNVSSSFSYGIRAALSKIASVSLTNCKMEELKEWEQQLESTLSHVRSIKEEKALEVQKKLDRQVEEQNELKLCVICLSNEKSILCLPCRHLCLCKTCSYRQEVTKCPMCRLEIEEMLAVYS
ncbi:unnamed protein product [Peronospora destructor]|uniref:RING-type domain-containing protein n=1 Tax=Peronospora destructor TaxID=86335 RepID=A0AAV0TNX9_9STRA|nr:unnamed protein product [Peronospora destructor]